MDHSNLHDLFGPEPWHDDPNFSPPRGYEGRPGLDRLTHLVLVDGRLVDVWTEPVRGTEWEMIAERFDADHTMPPPPEPMPQPHETALAWLDGLVGGRVNLEALDDRPLPPAPRLPVDTLPLPGRQRIEAVERLLDAVSATFFDDEVRQAMGAVLTELWHSSPEVVLRGKSAAHVAGGIAWAVGRANDLFGAGRLRQQQVQHELGLSVAISGPGQAVHHALTSFRPLLGHRMWSQPDRLALGSPAFLTSASRRVLVRLRDQAIAARDAHLADEARKAAALP